MHIYIRGRGCMSFDTKWECTRCVWKLAAAGSARQVYVCSVDPCQGFQSTSRAL